MASIAPAAAKREAKIEAARKKFSDDIARANADFAQTVARSRNGKHITELAREAGMSRQTLHGILRQHSSS